jgi:predicted nuclease of restriction endonuclease-like (RecB) superfamily
MEKFLIELGSGFAFVGRQYKLEVGDNDFYIDLLFYHLKLRCYVVIELTEVLPKEFKSSLPTIEMIEDELKNSLDNK